MINFRTQNFHSSRLQKKNTKTRIILSIAYLIGRYNPITNMNFLTVADLPLTANDNLFESVSRHPAGNNCLHAPRLHHLTVSVETCARQAPE